MTRASRFALPLSALALAAGCFGARAAPPPPAAPIETSPSGGMDFPHRRVWTAFPEVALRGDSLVLSIPRPFTALEVVRPDSPFVVVRCEVCDGAPMGSVRLDEVVHTPVLPHVAAHATLSEFALAVRDAAARGDAAALAPVMAPEFTFSFIGIQGVPEAFAAWGSDGMAVLGEVPHLLDRGLVRMDGGIWVAPPEHAARTDYTGLRLGFRRSPAGRWEWLFLIRGQMP